MLICTSLPHTNASYGLLWETNTFNLLLSHLPRVFTKVLAQFLALFKFLGHPCLRMLKRPAAERTSQPQCCLPMFKGWFCSSNFYMDDKLRKVLPSPKIPGTASRPRPRFFLWIENTGFCVLSLRSHISGASNDQCVYFSESEDLLGDHWSHYHWKGSKACFDLSGNAWGHSCEVKSQSIGWWRHKIHYTI